MEVCCFLVYHRAMTQPNPGAVSHARESARELFLKKRISHWDAVAQKTDHWRSAGGYYQQRLSDLYRFVIPPGMRVLEIGCGLGDLLSAVKPGFGVGIDFSREAVRRAAKRHPECHFVCADAEFPPLAGRFDIIVLSDLLNDLWDVERVLREVKKVSHPRTRIVLNLYSRIWEIPLRLAQQLGWIKPNLPQNWLTPDDISNLLHLTGLEIIQRRREILLPIPIPLISALVNRVIVKIWPFTIMALLNFYTARPRPTAGTPVDRPPMSVSIIIPARNEAGNIPLLIPRIPDWGGRMELIFVEGHSRDQTAECIRQAIRDYPRISISLFTQTGIGKGDAVRMGCSKASGDLLMILDADMTVSPEDLSRFHRAITDGVGEFINGVRLVYPMEDRAMPLLNLLGNRFFVMVFSWLLGQPVKDTLCGTKVFWKADYDLIAANRSEFGDFDPFGDFDLLFGAAKLNLKIVDIPIRYRAREHGQTNIQRWRHGWMLIKMVFFAARRIKFI
jgi:SAM-dependent methyltransferase